MLCLLLTCKQKLGGSDDSQIGQVARGRADIQVTSLGYKPKARSILPQFPPGGESRQKYIEDQLSLSQLPGRLDEERQVSGKLSRTQTPEASR